jgi:hypothetical protein
MRSEYRTVAIKFPQFPLAEAGLDVTPLGNGLYRLESSPMVAPDETELFFGDIIEATVESPNDLAFVRVFMRSPLEHWSFMVGNDVLSRPNAQQFLDRVMAAGGNWERIWNSFLAIHLPPGSRIKPEEEVAALLRPR